MKNLQVFKSLTILQQRGFNRLPHHALYLYVLIPLRVFAFEFRAHAELAASTDDASAVARNARAQGPMAIATIATTNGSEDTA